MENTYQLKVFAVNFNNKNLIERFLKNNFISNISTPFYKIIQLITTLNFSKLFLKNNLKHKQSNLFFSVQFPISIYNKEYNFFLQKKFTTNSKNFILKLNNL